jgi:hypothetical protein
VDAINAVSSKAGGEILGTTALFSLKSPDGEPIIGGYGANIDYTLPLQFTAGHGFKAGGNIQPNNRLYFRLRPGAIEGIPTAAPQAPKNPSKQPTTGPTEFKLTTGQESDAINTMRVGSNNLLNTSPGQPGWLGNPWSWEGNGGPKGVTKQDVVNKYAEAFIKKMNDPEFAAAVNNLRGKTLKYYAGGGGYPGSHVEWINNYLRDNPPQTSAREISSNSRGLLAALTNPTELARSKGNLNESFPVEFGGQTFPDAEAAYQAFKGTVSKDDGPNNTYKLMVDILKAKLSQHPRLTAAIEKNGGIDFINQMTHQPTNKNTVWETGGKNWFIKALGEAYQAVTLPGDIRVKRIISGGQTGADIAGLQAAKDLGIETGGWIPKGWRTQEGPRPEYKSQYNMLEHPDSSYPGRTMQNVDDADATIAFRFERSTGTDNTIGYAQTGKWGPPVGKPTTSYDGKKPVLVIDVTNRENAVRQIRNFLARTGAETINIAGHRESSRPGINKFVRSVLAEALKK